MLTLPRMLLIAGMAGIITIATQASAQPPNDSNISLNAPGFVIKKPKPGAPDVKAQPLAWPRLDPGAVFCRTEADLDRLGARRHGETVDVPVDCQIIRTATAISIVQRKGPGKAEVKVSASGTDAPTGWTDAWLPDKSTVGAKAASR